MAKFINYEHPTNDASIGLKHYREEDLDFQDDWGWTMKVVKMCFAKYKEHSSLYLELRDVQNACGLGDQDLVFQKLNEFIEAYDKLLKSPYPFQEGDEYYTLTKDGHLMFTIWDDISEEMHNEDIYNHIERVYFNQEQMVDFVKNNTLHTSS